MQRIWARKAIAVLEAEAEEPEVQALTTHNGVPLKRTLSAVNLVALGIGAIIGAGIFVLTGHAAAANAGPGDHPVVHPRRVRLRLRGALLRGDGLDGADRRQRLHLRLRDHGELIAWIIGWDLILEYALGAVTVAIGWSGYVVSFPEEHRHRGAAGICRVALFLRRCRAHLACRPAR